MRRVVREAIRKSGFTKSERDIITAMVNLWFYHKSGPKGYIHPGRTKLAKKARCSIRTVSACLTKLRASGVVKAVANPNGEGQHPTYYTVNLRLLLDTCGCVFPEELEGHLVPYVTEPNCTPLSQRIAHHWRAEIAHSLSERAKGPFHGINPSGGVPYLQIVEGE